MLNIIILLFSLLILAGCSGNQNQNEAQNEEQQEEAAEITEDTQLYLLLYCNPDTQRVFLESVETGRQEEFEYSGGTYIYDRYGSNATISQLQVGTVIQVTYTDKKMLTEIKESKDVFVYDEITNFKIDMEKGIISVADSNYYYDEALKVFSDSGLISMSELRKSDTICIRGLEKEILTLVVTKGHGTVRLKNTEIFEGGMITIGNVAAQEITEDMVLEVPEGTYTLSVAHNGYGGSKEITVNRFEDLTIDLDTLKGEGPGYCMMKITVTPSDAKVILNGAEVDCSQLLELRYGSYRLSAEAEGYTDWSGKLVVSSKEAAITIEMEEESEDEEEEDTQETDETDTSEEEETDETDTSEDESTKEDAEETDSEKDEDTDETENEADDTETNDTETNNTETGASN